MTEKEKMLDGQIYNTRDEELLGMYHTAKKLLYEYDNLPSDEKEEKFLLLKRLLGEVGEGVWIEKPLSCDYGKNISIGRNTFINYNCVFIDNNIIRIGEDCLIGPAVQIYTAAHPIHSSERIIKTECGKTHFTTYTKPITVGNNVWIGGGAILCPGVEVGDNTVIGAGSVVTKSIAADCVAYGNPCRVIRKA